jgi:glutamate synthase (NADPH) large chain
VDKDIWHAVKRGAEGEADEVILKRLVENHFRYTGSMRAKALLENWDASREAFVKVMPKEYRRALKELAVAARSKLAAAAV